MRKLRFRSPPRVKLFWAVRSELKKVGACAYGKIYCPFCPLLISGSPKQAPLMYWCEPRPPDGLHFSTGCRLTSGVPRKTWLFTVSVGPLAGVIKPLRPKFGLALIPVCILPPLWMLVIPEIIQLFTSAPSARLSEYLPSE